MKNKETVRQHRIMADTILYTPLFVDPIFEKTAIGLHLLAEAIRIHVALPHHPIIYAAFFLGKVGLMPITNG